MSTFWIVTANAGCAQIFSREAASKSQHSVGAPTQPSGYQPNQTPAEHSAEVFARDISRFLLHGYQDGHFQRIVLMASPEFLGILRSVLDSRLLDVVTTEINKDYTRCNPQELSAHLQSAA